MAVGYTDTKTDDDALAYQFDGTSWSLVTMPDPPSGAQRMYLFAVSCASASFCVAMGQVALPGRGFFSPVAERWDGTAWAYLPIDHPGSVDAADLDCPRPNTCLAVGSRTVHQPLSQAVAWVLRAGAFHPVIPARPSANNSLDGISCLSPTNCTAVGTKEKVSEPLIEHWNGAVWQEVQAPAAPRGLRYDGADLADVTCLRVGTCVAIGGAGYDAFGTALLASRVNGGPWRASTFQIDRGDSGIRGGLGNISCLSVRVCAATGSYLANECCSTAVIAWRDRSAHHFVVDWPQHAALGGISCIANRCIYVGQEYIDPAVNPDAPRDGAPVIYQGTGLHPVQQTIPLPTR